jgi:Zn-dependent protease with chaperone function
LLTEEKAHNIRMKKISLFIVILLLTSCATTQQTVVDRQLPSEIKARSTSLIHQRLYHCIGLTEGRPGLLHVVDSATPNAWVGDDKIVVLTTGIFKYSDEVLATVIAHELAHVKLDHLRNVRAVSYVTTGVFLVAGFFIPNIGLLNHVVNPTVTNNYSKTQEYEADKLASETLTKCFSFTIEQQVKYFQALDDGSGGGFMSTHPAWSDRIEAIKHSH